MSKKFAKWYDTFMNPLEQGKFTTIRRDLLKDVKGQVLEIGSGTGINFPFYQSAENVTAIEPSTYMIDQSISRRDRAIVPIKILNESAELLPFENNSFDTVVGTLVFCTIPNPDMALNEMKRVCKSGGRILLFEHVKMQNPFLSNLQNWLTPFWKMICDGCCLNRDTLQLLNRHGVPISHIKEYYKGLFILVEARNPVKEEK
jgi:ubiquinone/menaquinone biosynthesis C-methylase UbiE